ncbi:uncharacterized protein LACBIDRAFT_327350 [Laccaria bicolor S238N-H82]|uniref:non-specific serine/threonine protein kinase n=1 Tax=Laccaria bicolor (strain S238N-H82 / ATCC MYA-4686) TaxID=486041 RepID=B0DAT4_LACBS|nr:uncharacterized protein LACBIDRAFT_327350 [Laccaria bicolor S238N-H82]EDR08084.1 predicted protein [Laccaria bicolor S238N-H82]|eukprot:XP_001881154.1 predicted protein [Laccaria bicolor S238N-H82]
MTAPSAPLPAVSFDPNYFPARLNTSLNAGRYTILRKLGEGVSSSCWLVEDGEGEEGYKYLAAKILTIDATQQHEAGLTHELEFLKEIEARNDTDHLPMLRDHFIEHGPKGKHLCLVQDLYSTSVSSLRRSAPHKALLPYMVKNVILMAVEALAQLHAMNMVHTGLPDPNPLGLYSQTSDTDVKLDNLLFGNSLYSLDRDLQKYLEANPAQLEGEAQVEGETYPSVSFMHPTAQRAGKQPTADCFGALDLRAAETILQSDFGPAVDIWAVYRQTFPDKMLQRASLRKEYFDDTGNLLRIPELTSVSLETAMANYKIPNPSEDEIRLAADFIRACLKFDSEE